MRARQTLAARRLKKAYESGDAAATDREIYRWNQDVKRRRRRNVRRMRDRDPNVKQTRRTARRRAWPLDAPLRKAYP